MEMSFDSANFIKKLKKIKIYSINLNKIYHSVIFFLNMSNPKGANNGHLNIIKLNVFIPQWQGGPKGPKYEFLGKSTLN
jgi:hypothetical protein